MLVGASFCLIFKSHTKALIFISENASKVGEVCCFSDSALLLLAFPLISLFPVSDSQYFSSDFRYVMTVLSEYLR